MGSLFSRSLLCSTQLQSIRGHLPSHLQDASSMRQGPHQQIPHRQLRAEQMQECTEAERNLARKAGLKPHAPDYHSTPPSPSLMISETEVRISPPYLLGKSNLWQSSHHIPEMGSRHRVRDQNTGRKIRTHCCHPSTITKLRRKL